MLVLQSLANGLLLGCSYALVALGFGLIYNTTRVFHFAHGAVYTAGAYLFFALLGVRGWSLAWAFATAVALTAALGVLIDELVYYPLVRGQSSLLIQMLSSLGVYILLVNFVALAAGSETKLLLAGGRGVYRLGPLALPGWQVAGAAAAVAAFAVLWLLLKKTRLGVMIRAMRDDPELLSTVGVNPQQVRRVVFALGSALAGVSAILTGLDVGIDPHAGSTYFLYAATAVIIGGVGRFRGAGVGAAFLGVTQGLTVLIVSARWQDTMTFGVLLLFLLLRPEGLAAGRQRLEEA